jgi:hypothetical protein
VWVAVTGKYSKCGRFGREPALTADRGGKIELV